MPAASPMPARKEPRKKSRLPRPIATAMPENTTARPLVSIAVSSACANVAPPASSSR